MGIDFIIGRKIGMTRIFDNQGLDYPVTVIEAGPCHVSQVKSNKKDGYSAVQIGYLDKSNYHINNSEKGHFNKAGIVGKKILKEFNCEDLNDVKLGTEVNVDVFEVGDNVIVSGVSKGKGFAGHMKRHNFSGGRASHGKNSVMRKAGSVGAGTSPGRVWKGTRMAGRMGGDKVSVKNLLVVRVQKEDGLLFIKGAVPGSNNGIVFISKN